tara:strand:+ start:795 stop:1085 length:291 start_codon:yes stop_codon:yes gene_type:complete
MTNIISLSECVAARLSSKELLVESSCEDDDVSPEMVEIASEVITQATLQAVSKGMSEDLILKYFISYGITALKKHAPHHQIEHLVDSLLSAEEDNV